MTQSYKPPDPPEFRHQMVKLVALGKYPNLVKFCDVIIFAKGYCNSSSSYQPTFARHTFPVISFISKLKASLLHISQGWYDRYFNNTGTTVRWYVTSCITPEAVSAEN